MTDIATREPDRITAGDRWQWERQDLSGDYPAGTWTLTYSLVSPAARVALTATANGTYHLIDVAAATTAAYAPGKYYWEAYVTDVATGLDRRSVGRGEMVVRVDYAAQPNGFDGRTTAQQLLDKVEAALVAGNVLHGAYTVATPTGSSRTVQFRDRMEMLLERDRLKAEVKSEQIAERLAAGMGGARRLLVRM
jgi:hypothetical protein